jgi:hypothetical protein
LHRQFVANELNVPGLKLHKKVSVARA